ncbi:MAG TPA: penicillin acylase family protein, partial [Nakamurella multipartita]|nr:penicillin acylase family protein [Nakamurella multipartita]
RRNAVWGRELQGFVSTIEFGRAKSLAEFRQAASAVVQNFNLSYGGEDGHIEIWHSGLQPVRPAGVDPRLPARL